MSKEKDNVIVHIESMLSKMPSSSSFHPKIFKVPDQLRQVNESAYEPVLVSIGPIHHNKDHLKQMEQLKINYLHEFLQRKNETVEKYVSTLRDMEGRARNCYPSSIQLPETDKFVKMLLLDGFFLIQLLRKFRFPILRVPTNDYIFQSYHARKGVKRDLLLIENQLPFFIISQLFEMTKSRHSGDNLSKLVQVQLCSSIPWSHWQFGADEDEIDDHLLGMVYRNHFPSEHFGGIPVYKTINYTAEELKGAGIHFERIEKFNKLTDVSFTGGVMRLSPLTISDDTESILRNFIAYEQMMLSDTYKPLSLYASLMTCLVNSSKDVEILRRAKILQNSFGSDETAYLMFNKLGKCVINHRVEPNVLQFYKRVNQHYGRRCNKWMANLRRNYFNTPWAILSVIAAVILLVLTVIQTVYTVLK